MRIRTFRSAGNHTNMIRLPRGKFLRIVLVTAGIVLIISSFAVYEILWAPNTFEGERVIRISRGDTFNQIEDTLVTAGVIRSRILFNLAARLLGSTRRMQIGKYRFQPGMSNSGILEDIEFGRSTELVTVSIPEGMRTTRVAGLLGRSLGADSGRIATIAADTQFIRTLGLDVPSLEGYLMPSTYRFYWQEDEKIIVSALAGNFLKFFTDSLAGIAGRRGMTVREVLTLASIIEAETSVDSERARIAGVYWNRLKKRMRLQADPTIQYLIEDGPRRLTHADLQRSSPYNTYRNYGLPPGPINNPGRESILAALNPEKHGYYFFVASGAGGHTFSRTYPEHLRAVRKFFRKRADSAEGGS